MKQITLLLAAAMLLIACGESPNKKLDKSGPANNDNNVNNAVDNNANNVVVNNANNANNANNLNNVNNVEGVSGPCVTVLEETVSFGIVLVGEELTIPVGVQNCSNDTPLQIMVGSAGEFVAEPMSEIAPMSRDDLPVTFRPTSENEFDRDLTLTTSAGTIMLNVKGVGLDRGNIDATCPNPRISLPGATDAQLNLEGEVNSTIALTAENTVSEYEITNYFWTLVAKPSTSSAAILEIDGGRDITLTPDVAGNYIIELMVLDSGRATDCDTARIDIEISPSNTANLRIELTWDTPADTDQTDDIGTDLDIHYLHPSGTFNVEGYDVFWRKVKLELGGDGVAELVLDDVNGAGPEVIEHRGATTSQNYNVGVYYYADNGMGASYATLRIFHNGVLMHEYRDQYLANQGLFWKNTMVDPTTGLVDTTASTVQTGF